MKQTEKYQLNLIESSDRFLAEPINENTQALEDALVSHNADSNAHSALQTATSEHISNQSNPHGVTLAQLGAAASSHNHSAASITSGTLSTARGGTGNTSVDTTPTSGSTKMVTSGGVYTALSGKANTSHTHAYAAESHSHSEYAAASHNHSAANITSGALAVAHGGTGNTSVDTTPTSGSTKMVTSGGVYTALANKYGSDNAGWVVGSYTGDGVVDTAKSVNIGFQPSALLILSLDKGYWGLMLRSGSSYGSTSTATMYHTRAAYGHYHGMITPTSTGFTVLKNDDTWDYSVNEANITYLYIAFK